MRIASAARGLGPLLRSPAGADGTPRRRSLPMFQNSLALILSKVAQMGLGFLFWLVAARMFDPHDVGLAAGAIAAVMLCTQLALVGVGSAVISLFPEHRRDPAGLIDTSITLVSLGALVFGGLFLLLARGAFRQLDVVAAKPVFLVLFLAMCVLGTIGVLFDQISTSLRRGDQALTRGLLIGLLTLAAIPLLRVLPLARDAVALFACWVIGGAAGRLFGTFQLRRALEAYRYRTRIQGGLARRLFHVGLPNHLLTLVDRSPGLILPVIVTELLSPRQNAFWYAAWMMAWVVYIVPIQVGMTLFAEASYRPDRLARLIRHGVRSSLGLGLAGAAVMAVLAPFLLSFLGHHYAAAGATPLRVLLIGLVPMTVVQAYYAACRARRRLREAILTGLVSGVVGLVAAALAGRAHGLDGMAVTWVGVQVATGVWAAVRLRSIMRGAEPADSEGPARAQPAPATMGAVGVDLA